MAEAVVGNVALKDGNAVRLYGLLAANAALFFLLTHAQQLAGGDWHALLRGATLLVPAGIGVGLISILNGQIGSDTKARLVFMSWRHPYPSFRAFTYHGPRSLSVDMAALERRFGPLPTRPKEQNHFWYHRLFLPIADTAAVVQAHRHFLFARDYCFVSLMVLVGGGIAALFTVRPNTVLVAYLIFLAAQWLLTFNAAVVGGKRLVTIVLARSARP